MEDKTVVPSRPKNPPLGVAPASSTLHPSIFSAETNDVTPSPSLNQIQLPVPPPSSIGVVQYAYPTNTESHSAGTADLDAGLDQRRLFETMSPHDGPRRPLQELQQPRRSGRQTQSTLVHIDGHAVLKQNNYVLKGLSYEYGAVPDENTKPPSLNKTPATKPVRKKAPPRAPTESQLQRTRHNERVQKRIQEKQALRNGYLAWNLVTLKPFLDKKVQTKLETIPDSKAPNNHNATEQPDSITADMRDYQLDGLQWMANMYRSNLGMILGDEMGLGKTLQTISLLCHLKETEGITGPSLVICPLSVLYSWCNELKKWAPSLKFLRFHSSSPEEREAQRAILFEKATEYDVVVTTYEMAKNPMLRSLWSRQCFNCLVLDEGHRIKDADSQISQGVRSIRCETKLILTGTPLQNNLVELWALLNFLYPTIFVDCEPFSRAFNLTENKVDPSTLRQAHDLLGLLMLRRLKAEVEKLMPKKIETKVICPLSQTQIFWYKALLMKDINLLARTSDKGDGQVSMTSKNVLNNLIMQLRKCCLHPFLFDGAEVEPEKTTCNELVAASGKLAVLDKLLSSLYKKRHRVVLFSQFTTVLDILEDYCVMRGWNFCRFDGSTARAKRNYIVNRFNSPDSNVFIFLMSTRSGGIGLNLQTADTCILYDSDWNPQPDLQAMARVHRIGQKKTVHVYRLVCGGTVEERIVERAQKKLYLDQMVNVNNADSTNEDPSSQDVPKRDLLSTLTFGCDAVFGADTEKQNCLPTDDEIELITDRTRTETTTEGKLKGGATSKASDFEAERELTATTKLGGIDFLKIRNEHKKKKQSENVPKCLGGIADVWINIQKEKRKRKSRVIMVNSNGSGYGERAVPVLAANNYELEEGESSVFQRELGGKTGNYGEIKKTVKRSGVDFQEQDFCQVCGDGGLLMCCPLCPVCVHKECVGLTNAKHFMSCSHHRCSSCDKNLAAAGGILFPCQSCPVSFCEDCLPVEKPGVRVLGDCERFQKLGYEGKHFAYIHCSTQCEAYAKKQFSWAPPNVTRRPCPPALDLSHAFGSTIDEIICEEPPSEQMPRLRARKIVNYGQLKKESPPQNMNKVTAAASVACSPSRLLMRINSGLPSLRSGEYDAVLPVTPRGLMIRVIPFQGSTVFDGYRLFPNGSKGPAELASLIRNEGDKLIAVDGVSTINKSFRDVINMLCESTRNKFACVRFVDSKYARHVSDSKNNRKVDNGSGVYRCDRVSPSSQPSNVSTIKPLLPVTSTTNRVHGKAEVIVIDDTPEVIVIDDSPVKEKIPKLAEWGLACQCPDPQGNKRKSEVVTTATSSDAAKKLKKEEETESFAKKPSASKNESNVSGVPVREQNWHRMFTSACEEFENNKFSEMKSGSALYGWLKRAKKEMEAYDAFVGVSGTSAEWDIRVNKTSRSFTSDKVKMVRPLVEAFKDRSLSYLPRYDMVVV